MSVNKFCGNCGAPLQPGVRFCGQCGQKVIAPPAAPAAPVSPQPAAPPAAPAEAEEAVVGVIPNLTGGRGKAYNLVVTTEHLIGAELTAKMIADEAQRVTQEAKARGKGFLASMGERALAGFNYYKRYYTMPIPDIVHENRDNWALAVDDVESFNLEVEEDSPSQLTIGWGRGKTTTLAFKSAIPGVEIITVDQIREIMRKAGLGM